MVVPSRDRAATISLACSVVVWLCNLLIYTWHPSALILILDVISIGLAITAFVLALRALFFAWQKPLAWLAVVVSLTYPVWLALELYRLPSDAF